MWLVVTYLNMTMITNYYNHGGVPNCMAKHTVKSRHLYKSCMSMIHVPTG